MRRHKKNRRAILTDIPLTPLIDTALTLLIIFIVLAPTARHGLNVALPKTSLEYNNAAKEEIVITINKDGNYFWQNNLVAPELLPKLIAAHAQKVDCKTIFIRADKSVIYDSVLQLFEILAGIDGIEDVILPTEKR